MVVPLAKTSQQKLKSSVNNGNAQKQPVQSKNLEYVMGQKYTGPKISTIKK